MRRQHVREKNGYDNINCFWLTFNHDCSNAIIPGDLNGSVCRCRDFSRRRNSKKIYWKKIKNNRFPSIRSWITISSPETKIHEIFKKQIISSENQGISHDKSPRSPNSASRKQEYLWVPKNRSGPRWRLNDEGAHEDLRSDTSGSFDVGAGTGDSPGRSTRRGRVRRRPSVGGRMGRAGGWASQHGQVLVQEDVGVRWWSSVRSGWGRDGCA